MTDAHPGRPDAERDPLLRALSGLGILLVVIGHAEAAGYATTSASHVLPGSALVVRQCVKWILSFHMPLFFAISGFLLFKATLQEGLRPYRPRALYLSKLRRLLAPYVVISAIAFVPKAMLSDYALRPASLSFQGLASSLICPWNNPIIFYWYLPTLFNMFLVAPVLLARTRHALRDAAALALGVLGYLAFAHERHAGPGAVWNIAGTAHNFVFFALGFVAAKRAWLGSSKLAHILAALAVVLSGALALGAASGGGWGLLAALTGIITACVVASTPLQPWLGRLGDVSYQIYLLSWFPQTFARVAAARLPQLGFTGAVLMSVLLGLLLPLLAALVLQRVLPARWHFLFGGSLAPARASRPQLPAREAVPVPD